VRSDLDSEFIRSFAIALAWEYRALYDGVSAHPNLPDSVRNEEFSARRGRCAVRALETTARLHGVPLELRRLECNGQHKLLVKAGRLVLIQEPMISLSDHPALADYKKKLATTYGVLRQLEFDFGDIPARILDWSGILGVLLHGAAGPRFTEEHKALGGLVLGIPDAEYNSWVLRFDLLQIAMSGEASKQDEAATEAETTQPDRVRVTLKRKNIAKDSAG